VIPDLTNLDENAKAVLRLVAEQDMDGYTLRAKSRLAKEGELEKAINDLCSAGLLRVKGEPYGDGLLKAWYQASPRASYLLQRIW
jgi:DNA-binding PadR family transcriptional regulator